MIEITRIFDAPRERVWKAWTEPAEIAAWWGRRGWTARTDAVALDVRPGGAFRIVTVNDQDGREMVSEGVYREVVEPERLSFGEATVTFADLGDGRTRMDFRTSAEMTDEIRAAAAGGLASAFQRLAEHIRPEEPR